MKKTFLGKNFLLQTQTAFRLYYEYAETCPIIDYHCHLPPADIASNRQFTNLTELWLEGDHYKWRAMRANGIAEKFITGDASPKEKFQAWAQTVPNTLRNPLYHWTHLELRRYFGISDLLSKETADRIYTRANELINTSEFKVVNLLRKMKVELVCTSDDPIDDLSHHQFASKNGKGILVLPTWRPDRLLNISNQEAFNYYLEQLSQASGVTISGFDDFLEAIKNRHDYFHSFGCRLADHGLSHFVSKKFTHLALSKIFKAIRQRDQLNEDQILIFQSGMMHLLAVMNFEKGWVQQFHVGALRNTNPRLIKELGPNTGFDSIGSSQNAEDLSRFLGGLDQHKQLAPTILYNNNPTDNYMYATMIGNYQDGSIPGKMQFGAAWWFLDQKEGIEMQINALSNLGLLSKFVGMVTDSRSFLSFPRHEYFRRILCNILGGEIEEGLLPNDLNLIGNLIKDICYNNAKNYFGFEYPT